jgi:hypothetical protein
MYVCNFFENYTRLLRGFWILQTIVFVSFYVSSNEKDAECQVRN